MNKNAIKSFAIDARKWLIDKISVKLNELGITEHGIAGPYQQTNTEVKITDLSKSISKIQYESLKRYINSLKKSYGDNWYDELLEESAYTWFNRFIAIKYMEVNGYLPQKINVLTSTSGRVEPDIIHNYEYLDYVGELDVSFIKEGILNHQTEDVFRYLFLAECHQLSPVMKFMFAKENDFSDLLFPDNILAENGLVNRINKCTVDEDWQEIEVIGWMYQFYNSEKKDEVFAGLKNNKKLSKDTIPAVTQLFTPKWIVKYMVENSLGKLAIEEMGIRESIKENWKYFIEAEESEEKLVGEHLKIEDVKVLDPSMGSGHILVYAFDVLYQLYEELGYTKKEAVISILNNNLFGLDIDDRAATLAQFALIMKGREYFPRIFKSLKSDIKTNAYSIQESNSIDDSLIETLKSNDYEELLKLIELYEDAKEYGSILNVDSLNIEKVVSEFEELKNKPSLFGNFDRIEDLINQVKVMSQKYDVTVTNPPYMSGKGYSPKLKKYVEKNFKDSKSDMFAIFIEKCGQYTGKDRYTAMITMHSWMFLSSYEKLRVKLIDNVEILNLVHLGARAFEEIGGEVVQTVTWVMRS